MGDGKRMDKIDKYVNYHNQWIRHGRSIWYLPISIWRIYKLEFGIELGGPDSEFDKSAPSFAISLNLFHWIRPGRYCYPGHDGTIQIPWYFWKRLGRAR